VSEKITLGSQLTALNGHRKIKYQRLKIKMTNQNSKILKKRKTRNKNICFTYVICSSSFLCVVEADLK